MARRPPVTDVVELAAQLRPSTWGGFRGVEQLVGREELLKEEWGPADAKETHYLRIYQAQLRRKLEDDPVAPEAPADQRPAWAIAGSSDPGGAQRRPACESR